MTKPLVPPDVDLRGYEFMPLYGHRLFGSDFNAHCTDAEWRAALTLWWAAWNQVPASSLPDDDVALCRLADLGRDVKTWRKIKPNAMRGFVPCEDGRLYHKALAVWAVEAWDRRVKERQRKARWRRDKYVPVGGTNTGQMSGHEQDVPAEVKGSEVKGTIKHDCEVGVQGNGSSMEERGQTKHRKQGSWSEPGWVAATAKTLGVERRVGEDDDGFADRVYSEANARRRAAATR